MRKAATVLIAVTLAFGFSAATVAPASATVACGQC